MSHIHHFVWSLPLVWPYRKPDLAAVRRRQNLSWSLKCISRITTGRYLQWMGTGYETDQEDMGRKPSRSQSKLSSVIDIITYFSFPGQESKTSHVLSLPSPVAQGNSSVLLLIPYFCLILFTSEYEKLKKLKPDNNLQNWSSYNNFMYRIL